MPIDPFDFPGIVRAAILSLEPKFSRGELASMAGVSRSVMSDFLNRKAKQPQIGMDKVSNLARALRRHSAELHFDVPLPHPDTVHRLESALTEMGGVDHGVEVGSLKRQLDERDKEIADLKAAITEFANQLSKLGTRRRVRKTGTHKPATR